MLLFFNMASTSADVGNSAQQYSSLSEEIVQSSDSDTHEVGHLPPRGPPTIGYYQPPLIAEMQFTQLKENELQNEPEIEDSGFVDDSGLQNEENTILSPNASMRDANIYQDSPNNADHVHRPSSTIGTFNQGLNTSVRNSVGYQDSSDDLGCVGRRTSYITESFNRGLNPEPLVTLNRDFVYDDLSELFKLEKYRYIDPDEVRFKFEEEPAVGLGPTKEALGLFHIQGKDQLYEGDKELIPGTSGTESKMLGRVLYHTFMLTGGFPAFICKAYVFELLTEKDVRKNKVHLIKSYLNYLTILSGSDKSILLSGINDGLQNMSSKNKKDLFEVIKKISNFTPNALNLSIDENNWQEVLINLAHLDMIEKPACNSVADEFTRCKKMGECQLYSVDEAEKMINEYPTPGSIINKFKTKLRLTSNERKVFGFLCMFISFHCKESKMAERFLLYCTSSTNLPYDTPIKIEFNDDNGLTRAVRASTCGNLLHLPNTYQSYQEFDEEFLKTLTSIESFKFNSL